MIKDKVDATCSYARKYCKPIMSVHFVCGLLGFCARKFPAKFEKTPEPLSLTAPCTYRVRPEFQKSLHNLTKPSIFLPVYFPVILHTKNSLNPLRK